jgi:hypothetical protein
MELPFTATELFVETSSLKNYYWLICIPCQNFISTHGAFSEEVF